MDDSLYYWEVFVWTKVGTFTLKYKTRENAILALQDMMKKAVDDLENRESSNHTFEDDYEGLITFCPMAINCHKIERKYNAEEHMKMIRALEVQRLSLEVGELRKKSRSDSWREGDSEGED